MDQFCVQPWYGMYYLADSTKSPCCLLPADTNISTLKQEFKRGLKPNACSKCWKNESNNIKSKRQLNNEFLDYKLDTDISILEANAYNDEADIVTYQISVSNLCNGACVTCSSAGSTAWAKYEKKMGVTPNRHRESSSIDINYSTAKSIIFTGGEPLYEAKVFEILSNLIKANNTDCFISFVTNGSTILSDERLKILEQFSDINFCISIDGTEKVFEYLRFPLKWEDLLSNLEFFKSLTNNISISYTISNIASLYSDETIAWFKEQGLPYTINKVLHPYHFNPEVMPGHKLWNEFSNIIKLQDKAKGINIKDYLSEMHKLIEQGETDV